MNECCLNGCLNGTINPGDQCPAEGTLVNRFTQIVINHTLEIPEQKPDIEFITNVIKNFKIDDVQVIDVNLGGDPPVTGKKVSIAGTLCLGIEYSAAMDTQEVHFAHFSIPFKALIRRRPCTENRGLLYPGFDINNVNIRFCVEHEQYHVISPREISKTIVLLIWLEDA